MNGDWLSAKQGLKTDIGGEEPWIKNPEAEVSASSKSREPSNGVSLFGPLFIWALVIIIGIILEVIVPAVLGKGLASYATFYKTAGNYILTLPGAIILPLIISVWIGHKVGEKASSVAGAARLGIINGVYASIVYGVIIFVAQLLLKYTTSYALSYSFMLEYLAAIPIAIVLVFTVLIAMLNRLRQ